MRLSKPTKGEIAYIELVRSAIQATVIRSAVSYTWFGRTTEKLPSNVHKAMTAKTARNYLQAQLQGQLYNDLYIRGEAKAPIWGDEGPAGNKEELVERLSSANRGRGYLQGGWEVVTKQSAEVAVKRHGLTLWVTPEDLDAETANNFALSGKVKLRMPKELRNVSPGYYFAFSDKSGGDDDAGPLARLYWNLKADGAPLMMQTATELLNGAGCYFQLKLLNTPSSYSRCDAGVLYIKKADYTTLYELLRRLYEKIERYLKPRTPAFTKVLAPGLGLAEDPGQSESFGQHRCRLLADGIIRAQEQGAVTIEDRSQIVCDRFSEYGIDIGRPFLCPGSEDNYIFELRAVL